MRTEIRAAAVGFCCADVYENLGKWYPTGNGIDWGIHLRRMGVPMSVVSVVGNDSYGRGMKKVLAEEGMDISHLRTEEGSTCLTRMALKNGTDRVHLESVDGVMEHYALTEEELRFVEQHDLIHTDLFGNALAHLPRWKAAGVKILMDFSVFTKDPAYACEKIFPYVDYVFFSADGISREELEDWVRRIHGMGPVLVTATMGEEGSLCFDGKKMYHYGIVKTDVVNTVGAGDSYIAGFTYGILQGWTIPDCMAKGAELAASVISKFEPY
ncbi:fructoselysine 6-kinase [Anaerotignum lactatifermentans]|nr:fructoselysine 6-kinase [Anaerotignum lactatifermentans]